MVALRELILFPSLTARARLGLALVGDRDSEHPGHFGLKLPASKNPFFGSESDDRRVCGGAGANNLSILDLHRHLDVPVDMKPQGAGRVFRGGVRKSNFI
jgi:hypothetical protein